MPVQVPPTNKVEVAEAEITPTVKSTFPATVRLPPVKFNVLAAPPKVKLLQLPVTPVDIAGQLVIPAAGITTAVAEVGTPPHQLAAFSQAELAIPSQVPVEVVVKVAVPEVPPTGVGLNTVIAGVPADAISTVKIAAVTCVELTKVVVLSEPPIRTTDELLKPVPFTVNVNAPSPAHLRVGEMEVTVGDGLLTVKELLLPVCEPPEVRIAVRVTLAAPGVRVTL